MKAQQSQITETDKPVQKSLLKRIIIAILIFLFLGFVAFERDLIFQKFHDSRKPEPVILVTTAIGQHFGTNEGMYGGIDQVAYLAKYTKDRYYLFF